MLSDVNELSGRSTQHASAVSPLTFCLTCTLAMFMFWRLVRLQCRCWCLYPNMSLNSYTSFCTSNTCTLCGNGTSLYQTWRDTIPLASKDVPVSRRFVKNGPERLKCCPILIGCQGTQRNMQVRSAPLLFALHAP